MKNTYENVCPRCGKKRIVVRIWKEKIEGSTIENIETACPDKLCQKMTDNDIKKRLQKKLQIEERRIESIKNRKIAAMNKALTLKA